MGIDEEAWVMRHLHRDLHRDLEVVLFLKEIHDKGMTQRNPRKGMQSDLKRGDFRKTD